MKIIKSLLILCIAVALQLSASGSPFWGKTIKPNGDVVTETFDIPSSSYNKIEASSSADVKIVGGSGDIVVKIDSNVLPYLVVKVSGDRLEIGLDHNSSVRGKFTFEVQVPHDGDLKSISASGGAAVVSELVLDGDNIELSASGGSDINVECKSQTLIVRASGGADVVVDMVSNRCEAKASGGSDITLTGRVNHADLSGSGGADICARNLTCATSDIRKSGGADIRIQKK